MKQLESGVTTPDTVREIDIVDIPDEIVGEMANAEFNIVTGVTLADALRNGLPMFPQERGWGDGIHSGCALTTAAAWLNKEGLTFKGE